MKDYVVNIMSGDGQNGSYKIVGEGLEIDCFKTFFEYDNSFCKRYEIDLDHDSYAEFFHDAVIEKIGDNLMYDQSYNNEDDDGVYYSSFSFFDKNYEYTIDKNDYNISFSVTSKNIEFDDNLIDSLVVQSRSDAVIKRGQSWGKRF